MCPLLYASISMFPDVMANKTASREWMRKTATATLWPVELATLAGLTRWLAHLLLAKMALASRLPGSVFSAFGSIYQHFRNDIVL